MADSTFITLNRDALKHVVRQALLRAVASSLNSNVSHSNRDAIYSPSRWWVDSEYTVRHSLSTSGSASFSPSSATLTINLGYRVITI